MTDHFELSIMIGRRAISGSVAMTFRNVVIAASESSIPSSMLTSRMLAPPRTWPSATSARLDELAAGDEPRESLRAGDVGPLADHDEVAVGADGQRFKAGELGEPVRDRDPGSGIAESEGLRLPDPDRR